MPSPDKVIEKSLAMQILNKMQEYLHGNENFTEEYLTVLNRFIVDGYITSEEQLIKIMKYKEVKKA